MNHQVALVTGSSRGIGLAIAIALAKAGIAVAINGSRESSQLQNAKSSIEKMGVKCIAIPFDVSEYIEHDNHLDAVEASLGPITTLVNNAGISVLNRGDLLDVSEASWDRCLAVNAKALFFLSQKTARRMIKIKHDKSIGCSIINITSSNAVAVAETRAEYCASKAAAAMVSKAFAVRLGREGIPVYDVQPGLISTDMTAPVIDSYASRAKEGLTLIPRVGEAEEIGTIVASLATGKLPYTTGQAISADGGMLISRF